MCFVLFYFGVNCAFKNKVTSDSICDKEVLPGCEFIYNIQCDDEEEASS